MRRVLAGGYAYAEHDSANSAQDGTGDSSAAGQYALPAGLSLSSYTATNSASASGQSSQAVSWSNADGNGNSASQDFSTTTRGNDTASQHEEGTYAGGQLSLSSFVSDRSDRLSYASHDSGSTKSAPPNSAFSYASGYTNDSNTSNTQAVHQEGTYQGGNWNLSGYVLDQGSVSSSHNQQSGSSTTPEGTGNTNSDQHNSFNQTLHEEGTYAAGQLALTAHHRVADTASSNANESSFSGPSFGFDNVTSSNNTAHEDETGSGVVATDTVTTSGSTTGPGPNGTPVTNSYQTVNTYSRPIGGTLFLTPSVLFVAPSPVLAAANTAPPTSSGNTSSSGNTGSTGSTGSSGGSGSAAGAAGSTTTVTRGGVTFVTVTDAAGRVVSITGTDASGKVVEYHAYLYDAAGNVLTQTDGSNTTAYGYDSAGRKTSETVAYGTPQAATTTYAYDDAGNLVQVTDPDGNVTKFAYDASNRLISTTDPLGHTETRGYDNSGRLAWIVSRDGLKRAFAYDSAGRLLTETWYAADGVNVTDTLSYTYDNAGRLLTASNGYGSYTFTYDSLGRIAGVQEPVGLTLTFGYDAQGNRVLVQDSLGGVTQSVYNAAKQLVQRLFSSAGYASLQVNLAYDDAGRLSAVTRQTGTTATGTSAYAYDYDGRLLELQDSTGGGMPLFDYRYSFDTAGQLTGESLNGTTTSYNYDPAGQLQSDGTAGYAYDASGNRDTTGYVIGPGNQVLTDGTWKYTYDADGNVIGKVNLVTGETWQYRFDTIDHLTHAEHRSADGTLEASVDDKYDVFGNRIEMDVDTGGVQVTSRSPACAAISACHRRIR